MSTRTRMRTIWCALVGTTTIAVVAAQVGLSVHRANRRRHCWRPRSPQPRLRPVEPPTHRTALRAMERTSTTEHSGRPFAAPSFARHGSGALRISSSPSSKQCLRRRRRARCRPNRRGPGIPHVSEPACRGRQAGVVESRRAERNVVAWSDGRPQRWLHRRRATSACTQEGESSRPPNASDRCAPRQSPGK